MKFSDAYPSFTELALSGAWRLRVHKRWFGLFPNVLVLEVQVMGYINENDPVENLSFGEPARMWRDATPEDVRVLGLSSRYPHG